MTHRRKWMANLWLIAIAVGAGIGLFFGLMPGMDPETRADSHDGWTQTGFLGTARTHLSTATLLSNGQVLLAGGQAGQDGTGQGMSNATAVAELFDPETGVFNPTGSMASARTEHTATLLQDGRVLVAGGIDETGTVQAAAELYDSATGAFISRGSMTTGRARHVALGLPDGTVLIIGGYDGNTVLSSAEVYDPVTGLFSPTGAMQAARSSFSAVLLDTGHVLVMGGYGEPGNQPLDSAELYDPVTGTFTPTGSLQTGRADSHHAVGLQTGDVLVVGGVGPDGRGLSSAEIYSPASGTFAATGSMSTGRQHHSLTVLPNGRVLVAGGWIGVGETVLASVEIYDPDTGRFSLTEALGTGRGHHTATLLNNGTVLIAGGSGEASLTSAALASAEVFVCSTCSGRPEAPTQVVAIDVASDQGGSVRVTWTASSSSGVQEYRVYSSATAGGPYALVATLVDPSATVYVDTDLTNDVPYYYVVRAFDGTQESDNSDETSAMAIDNVVPTPPASLIATDVPNDDGAALSLSWAPSASDDIVEQRLYRSLVSGGPYALVSTLAGNATNSVVDTGLTAGATYYYALAAFDGTQESPLSAEVVGQPRDNRLLAQSLQIDLVEDASASITLLAYNPEGGSVTYAIATPPAHGQLSGSPPDMTYTPTPDFNGTDSFQYVVSNGTLTSAPAVVTLTIAAVNDPPVAMDDAITIAEDATNVLLNVLANDTTAPDAGEGLTVIGIGPPNQGGLVNVALDQQALLYTPAPNFSGTETFAYTVSDGSPGSQATATVVVTVTPVNDAPSVAPFTLSWAPSPSPNVVEQHVYRSTTAGGPYQLVGLIQDPTATSFTDTNGLQVGTAYYYVVRAYDGIRESVNSEELRGVAGRRSVLVSGNTPVNVVLPGHDVDGDALSYVLEQGPQYGVVTGKGPNLVYTPGPDFTGSDSLTYKVTDGTQSSETGTIILTASSEMSNSAEGGGFTAYNDLAWGAGQLNMNITTYTSPSGGSGLASSGPLVDFATGATTGVTLTVAGGEFNGESNAAQGAEPVAGTDAYATFNGIVSIDGAISYINDANDALVLTFAGLDPNKTYDVVFTGHRDKYAWDRGSLVTISGADAFTNASSAATDNPNEVGGVLFTGPTDPSTRLPADNDNGYVARFAGINPGSDGEIVLTISWDGTAGSAYKGKYGSAVMLREYAAP